MNTTTVREVAEQLRIAHSVLFITGAGISADSGLPTYRGVGGLYEQRDTEDDVAIEEALSGPMFAARPALTWKYMWQIGAACRGAQPNPAHTIIAQLEAEKPEVWVVTQNVDGLHRAAGSKNLVEVHGNIDDLICVECGATLRAVQLLAQCGDPPPLPPRCSRCQGILRPEVVLFGEFLPPAVIESLDALSRRHFDITFAIGTSAPFPYIREPIHRASRCDAATVEINPTTTPLSHHCRYTLRMGAAEALRQLRESP